MARALNSHVTTPAPSPGEAFALLTAALITLAYQLHPDGEEKTPLKRLSSLLGHPNFRNVSLFFPIMQRWFHTSSTSSDLHPPPPGGESPPRTTSSFINNALSWCAPPCAPPPPPLRPSLRLASLLPVLKPPSCILEGTVGGSRHPSSSPLLSLPCDATSYNAQKDLCTSGNSGVQGREVRKHSGFMNA